MRIKAQFNDKIFFEVKTMAISLVIMIGYNLVFGLFRFFI